MIATAPTTALRPDVARLVMLHASRTLRDRGTRQEWRSYGRFQRDLSRVAGWDAPPWGYDPAQWHAAVAAYLDQVRR